MTAFVVGFSEVKLRLPMGIPLASGLNIVELAGGDLHARALVIQHADYAVGILSCDLFGLPGRFVSGVRNIVYAATKRQLEALALMITATHTHHAPALPKLFPTFPAVETESLGMKYDDEALTRQLGEQLAATVIHAWNNRHPALIKIGSGHLSRDALHNRRSWDSRAGEPDLEILTLEFVQEQAISHILYNINTHPLNEIRSKTYDADIFGMISTEMKRRLGDTTILLPLIGAAGNINLGPQQGLSEKVGIPYGIFPSPMVQMICDGIESGLKTNALITGDALRVIVKLISIPVAEPEFADNFPYMRITGNDPIYTLDTQVQVIQLGRIVIVGVPGEPMAAIGQKIKAMGEQLGFQEVLVASLANDFIGYYFTPESFDAGGYETHFCVHRDAGNIILKGVEDVLQKLKDFEEDSET